MVIPVIITAGKRIFFLFHELINKIVCFGNTDSLCVEVLRVFTLLSVKSYDYCGLFCLATFDAIET